MSQHDLTIANQGFPAFRADLNDALQALGSCQSGTSAPSPTFANQIWYDTTNNILKIRNEDNDAWISIATLDQLNDVLSSISLNTINEGTSGSGVTVDGVLLKDNAITASADSSISGLTVGKGVGAISTATVVGAGAMAATNTGADNTAIGYVNLRKNTSGANNTGLGSQAFSENTTGASNTAIGRSALSENTAGSFNTAIGSGSLVLNTTANNNTAVGYQAGATVTTGYENVFIGQSAGKMATGNRNLFAGNGAGFNSTGSNNTFVGGNGTAGSCGESMTSGAKNTIVGGYTGNQNDLDLRTLSNRIVLSDGDGNPRVYNSNDGVTRLFTASQNTLTNNSKGGIVTILPRNVFFPASYFDAIDSCTIYINCVASEGTAGGYTRTDILHVNYRFGYAISSLGSNANDGVSVSTWTYSFDSNGLRVTQNWGAGGSNLGCRWSFFITGCLFLG